MGVLPRASFRQCSICKKGHNNDEPDQWILVCNCNSHVHRRCQVNMMTESGLIRCKNCKDQFNGIKYQHEPKSEWRFLWECDNAFVDFITNIGFVISMLLIILSFLKILFYDFNPFIEEITDFDFQLNKNALQHNFAVVMIINAKVIVPLFTLYHGMQRTKKFITEWIDWQQTHFNVTVQPEIDSK